MLDFNILKDYTGRNDYVPVIGKIRVNPLSLYYDRKDKAAQRSVEWLQDIETAVGDIVWFNYMYSIDNGILLYTREDIDNKINRVYLMIPYDKLYLAKRGDEVIMLNGYILIKPDIVETFKSDYLITPELCSKYSDIRGIVTKYIGKPNKEYISEMKDDYGIDVKEGDKVLLEPYNIFLEDKYFLKFDGNEYYVVQRPDIKAIIYE
jgi:co-chaperonin GroES (HSP10)